MMDDFLYADLPIEDYFDDGPPADCDCADCLDEQDFAIWEAEVS